MGAFDDISGKKRPTSLGFGDIGSTQKAPAPIVSEFDPTIGMPPLKLAAAGYGKSIVDIGRGARQLFNIGDQAALLDEINESRRLDAPLLKTELGMAGNISGSLMNMLPAMAVPGANTVLGSAMLGLGMGALSPTRNDSEAAAYMLSGTLLGGAGAAGMRAIPTTASAVAAPFYKRGQEAIIGRTLNRFGGAGASQAARNAEELVPGSFPTLAEASQNAGLASLQLAAMSNPEVKAALMDRMSKNTAARLSAIGKIAGDDASLEAAKQARHAATAGLYAKAEREGVDRAVSAALQPQLDSLMRRPSVGKAIEKARGIFNEEDIAQIEGGSVRGLQLVKQTLDDMIEKAGSPSSSIGKNELRALQQTRSDLISTLEDLSPAVREADAMYARMSRPVNQMQVGQMLQGKMVPSLMDFAEGVPTRIRAEAYAKALQDGTVKSATGRTQTLESVMEPEQLAILTGVARDLARKASSEDLAKTIGSTTAQNLSGQNLLAQIAGPIGIPQSWAQALAASSLGRTAAAPLGWIYKPAGEPGLQAVLAQALTDPKYAATLMDRASVPWVNPALFAALKYPETMAALLPAAVNTK